jgi:ribosomal protein L40E
MPIRIIDGEARYVCDVCNAVIEHDIGVMCPTCGRFFCLRCEADNPIVDVQVRKTGPSYKQWEAMCPRCKAAWRAAHPEYEEVTLDAYLIQT